jgi:hypothetical protein
MIIKIIWDFRGDDSDEIAKHHAIHLKQFCEKENIPFNEIDTSLISDFYTVAFITTEKENVNIIRDALKPHRAEVVTN